MVQTTLLGVFAMIVAWLHLRSLQFRGRYPRNASTLILQSVLRMLMAAVLLRLYLGLLKEMITLSGLVAEFVYELFKFEDM